MKILIIEDDFELSDFLKKSFLNDSHIVDTTDNGNDGSYMARISHYDIIIIDYSLPRKNGLQVCSEIRGSNSSSLILFLSTTITTQIKVQCFEAGADDYLTKPFALDELKARIKALTRRPAKIEDSIIIANDVVVDLKKQIVRSQNKIINLTRTEYNLIEYMVRNKGMLLSRGMILEHVWSANSDPLSNTVEAHIANIRRKFGGQKKCEIIRNVAGRGYIIDA